MPNQLRASGVMQGDPVHPLESLRLAAGVSQRSLCRAVGISTNAYRRHVSSSYQLDDTTVTRIETTLASWNPATSPQPKPLPRPRRGHVSPRSRDFLYPVPPTADTSPVIVVSMLPVTVKWPRGFAPLDDGEMFARWKRGETIDALAKRYGISKRKVSTIITERGSETGSQKEP